MAMYIYKITCGVSGKIYIGKSQRSVTERFRHHLKCTAKGNPRTHLARAICKYGRDAFKIEKICKAKDLEELNNLERHYIKKYKSYKSSIGYNLTMGGEGGSPPKEIRRKWRNKGRHSKETRAKMSKIKLEQKFYPAAAIAARMKKMSKMSEEERIKYSTRFRKFGKENPFFGKTHSKEVRKRISKAHKGIACRGYGWKHPKETRDKMKAAWKIRRRKMQKRGGNSR